MITDPPPRGKRTRAEFDLSDATTSLSLPDDDRLERAAHGMDTLLRDEKRAALERACRAFSRSVCAWFEMPRAAVRVLAARPRTVRRDGATEELFGDYDLDTGEIRVWMRTAVRRKPTAYGTFLSTLCHELCHHLDLHAMGMSSTPHTRGFYERSAQLYHAARGTPRRRLSWVAIGRGCFRVDWQRLRVR